MAHHTDKYRERKHCQRYAKGLEVHDTVKLGQPKPLFLGAGESKENTCANANRSYTWTCAVCHRSTSKLEKKRKSVSNVSLINAFNVVKEKLEEVIKMHIPKLCNDIALLKSITERISKQNEELIEKIDILKSSHGRCKVKAGPKKFWSQNYRKRKFLTYKVSVNRNKKDSHTENKTGHCRARKRTHLLQRMFLLFNRKRKRCRMTLNCCFQSK